MAKSTRDETTMIGPDGIPNPLHMGWVFVALGAVVAGFIIGIVVIESGGMPGG